MPDPDPALLDLFGSVSRGVLITLRRDGRPQSSVVGHGWDAATRTARISVTDGRAKTANLRRDPRASYHVTRPDGWAYTVGEALAELSAVAADPQDPTVEALVGLYRDLAGEHGAWAEFRAAMVAERRLLLTLRMDRVYGMAGS